MLQVHQPFVVQDSVAYSCGASILQTLCLRESSSERGSDNNEQYASFILCPYLPPPLDLVVSPYHLCQTSRFHVEPNTQMQSTH